MSTKIYYFADGILENPEISTDGACDVSDFTGASMLKVYECKPEELDECIRAALLLNSYSRLDVYEISKQILNDDVDIIFDGIYGRLLPLETIKWNNLTLIKQIKGNTEIIEEITEDE